MIDFEARDSDCEFAPWQGRASEAVGRDGSARYACGRYPWISIIVLLRSLRYETN